MTYSFIVLLFDIMLRTTHKTFNSLSMARLDSEHTFFNKSEPVLIGFLAISYPVTNDYFSDKLGWSIICWKECDADASS